jgi:murein DD-endopeptidase MepM/ murein hydrolase activator NlpD
MLGSFRLRLLIVIIIVFLTGLSLQSENSSKKIVEPVVRFVLKDYGVEEDIRVYIAKLSRNQAEESSTVSSTSMLQRPCEYEKIEQKYGWYWDEESNQQEFYPAILLKVEPGSGVRPVLDGLVEDITREGDSYILTIDHGGGLYSLYGGLTKVMVEENSPVTADTEMAENGRQLYFQMKSEDGPLNPNQIFE